VSCSRNWQKIAITLIMAMRWALECNGLVSTVDEETADFGIWMIRMVFRSGAA